jgi:hypothetical protein
VPRKDVIVFDIIMLLQDLKRLVSGGYLGEKILISPLGER